MTDVSAYVGRWSVSDGRLLEVVADGADLILRHPGVPADFAPRAVCTGSAPPAFNRGAVYATDDGWWALWFAIVDRDRLRGSIRTGVEDFTSPDGRRLPVYFFSVDHRMLPERPWRDGWLYLLPRAGFEHLGVVPGGPPSHEWCRAERVTPLARLRVTPADFPFLDQVNGHDDGDLIRLGELSDLVRERALAGRRTPGGVALQLRWDDTLAAVSEEFLELGHRRMPEVAREFRHDPDGTTWLHLDAPADLAAMLRLRYADVIGES